MTARVRLNTRTLDDIASEIQKLERINNSTLATSCSKPKIN
jgi:hypothetical protein